MSKMQHDVIQHFIFDKRPIRGELICLEHSFQTMVQQHAYPPEIGQLLGETLCIAGLLTATIKFDGRLTVQFRGKGKLKLLLAQCNNQLHLRGLAKWEGDFSYDELMLAFKDGVLAIMLDADKPNERYQGIVAWQGDSLAQAIEGYFKDSEQLQTKIYLQVNATKAVGLLLQAVPTSQHINNDLTKEMDNQNEEQLSQLSAKLNATSLLDWDFQDILPQLFPDQDIRIFPSKPVIFRCQCSQKKSENAILILGQQEAEDELKNNHHIVVTCDFCNKKYMFDAVDVARIFHTAGKNTPPSDIYLS